MRFYFTEQISQNRFRTPEKFLLCKDCVLARTGIQLYTKDEMPYEPDANGFIHVERTPEEVFRPESIASFAGKPFVIQHPNENGEIVDVTPENWQELACGIVLNPRRGTGVFDDVLIADILITRADAIELVLNHPYNELSCGYDADYVALGPGKARQVTIVGNHVAWVEGGRCGPKCRINDSEPTLNLDQEKIMAAKVDKTGWIADLVGRAFKARDAAELATIEQEAKDGMQAKPEDKTSDGDHTHIHLHPHSSGDSEVALSPAVPAKTEAPLVPKVPNVNAPTGDDSENRLTALEQGHANMQGMLQQIMQALGINEDGSASPDDDLEESGDGTGFGDELSATREQYNRKPNEGIYNPSDYKEGDLTEGEPLPAFEKNKPLKNFEMEAPPGTSGAINTGDRLRRLVPQRRRVAGRDSNENLRAEWERMISDAEIIIPGVRIPTVDSKTNPGSLVSTMASFRRRVLERVSQDLDASVDLDNLTGGIPIRQMTADSVSAVFRGLATITRDRNNTGVLNMVGNVMPAGQGAAAGISSIASYQKKINDMADDVWGTGGATR